MFSSTQSIPGLIFARPDVKAKIRPGVEAIQSIMTCLLSGENTAHTYMCIFSCITL